LKGLENERALADIYYCADEMKSRSMELDLHLLVRVRRRSFSAISLFITPIRRNENYLEAFRSDHILLLATAIFFSFFSIIPRGSMVKPI
jgi:hypothetical protein